jgi:RecB family exonuclease
MLELFEREWTAMDDGTVPPDLRRLFRHENGVTQLFLEAMDLLEAEHGNLFNEYLLQERGGPVRIGTDSRRRPACIVGKIDRVDVHRTEKTRAVVVDYKTGRSVTRRELQAKMEDGRMLQLPLYAAALARLFPELDVVGGAYVHLNEREERADRALARAGDLRCRGMKPAEVPLDPAAAARQAVGLIDRIRGGDFSLTEHAEDSPFPECSTYCPTRHACRQPAGYQRFTF